MEGLVFENLMHTVKRFVTYSITWIKKLIWNLASTQYCFFDTQEMWLSEKDKTTNSMLPLGFGGRDMNVKTFFLLVFLGRSGLHFLGKKMFVLCVNHTVTKYERGGGIDSIPCDFTTYKKKYSRSSTQSSYVLNQIICSHYQSMINVLKNSQRLTKSNMFLWPFPTNPRDFI